MERKRVWARMAVSLLASFVAAGTAAALSYDQDVLTGATIVGDADDQDGVIYGSGNANGGFTLDTGAGVELGLRTHERYPSPTNTYNSNGDGTYSWDTGGWGTGGARGEWNFDWSIFVSSGNLDDYTYVMGVDYDPSAGASFATWDLINNPVPDVDHAILLDAANGSTVIGDATSGPSDPATNYVTNIGNGVAAQNSWNMAFMNGRFPLAYQFDPTAVGTYDIYLIAYSGDSQVARTDITVFVGGGAPVPEPATMTVFGLGIAGMSAAAWRRKRRQV